MSLSIMETQNTIDSATIDQVQQKTLKMFEIIPQLYLSKFPDTIPSEITHILNMCRVPHTKFAAATYLHIPLDDIDNITSETPKIIEFIGGGISEGGKVLVHCALGLNRSASAVLAYLCHVRHFKASEGLRLLKERKPDVKPCYLFVNQINVYFGWKEEGEDPMARFHRRLEERKAGRTGVEGV